MSRLPDYPPHPTFGHLLPPLTRVEKDLDWWFARDPKSREPSPPVRQHGGEKVAEGRMRGAESAESEFTRQPSQQKGVRNAV